MVKGASSYCHHTSPTGVSLFGGIHIRGHATGRRMAAGSPRSSCCYPPRPRTRHLLFHSPSWAKSGSCSGMFSGAYLTTARLINKSSSLPSGDGPFSPWKREQVHFEGVDEAIPAHVACPLFGDSKTPTVRLPSPSVKTQSFPPRKMEPEREPSRHFLERAKGVPGLS